MDKASLRRSNYYHATDFIIDDNNSDYNTGEKHSAVSFRGEQSAVSFQRSARKTLYERNYPRMISEAEN
jgi:hypothetical protein